MSLFPSYLDGINQVLERRVAGPQNLNKGHNGQILNEQYSNRGGVKEPGGVAENTTKTLIAIDRQQLEKLFGSNRSAFADLCIGSHPDFSSLGHNEVCYHYCVSMFIDIKGSTKLAVKYSLPEIRRIKDTVLTLCIQTANFFGGHIHRLQGDAAFIQFVRKGLHPNDAIINALNTASVLCQFISTELAERFIANGADPIKVRVGIDYGRKEEVLWAHYGIPQCSELTTTSLHTDLAAKLQAQAANNEIRIGENVKEALDLPDEFWQHAGNNDEKGVWQKDYYIFNYGGKLYRKYIFNWSKYLRSFDFMETAPNGKSLTVKEKNLRLICKVIPQDGSAEYLYHQNSHSLPKGVKLHYFLYENGRPYARRGYEKIKWKIVNRGAEAEAKEDLGGTDLEDKQAGSPKFETSAAYLGHHYLKCTVEYGHSPNQHFKFPIFVQ